MHLHAEAFAVFAERHGLAALTQDDRARLDGRRNSEIFPILFKRDVPRDEWQAYEREKEGLYRELSKGRLTPMKGLHALLARLAREGYAGCNLTMPLKAAVLPLLSRVSPLAGAARSVNTVTFGPGGPAPVAGCGPC